MKQNLSWTRGGTPAAPSRQERSLSQTRLDRICHYPAARGTYFRSFVRWLGRLNADPGTYSTTELKRRSEQIGGEIARLEKLVRDPPPEMTGAEWEKAEDRLQFLWGQQKAIEETLRGRSFHRRGNGSGNGSSPSTPTTEPDTTENDIFSGE